MAGWIGEGRGYRDASSRSRKFTLSSLCVEDQERAHGKPLKPTRNQGSCIDVKAIENIVQYFRNLKTVVRCKFERRNWWDEKAAGSIIKLIVVKSPTG